MDTNVLTLIVTGKDAQAGAEAIKQIIHDEFRFEPGITAETHWREAAKAFDPITLTALLLAIPGAILAVDQIVERVKTKRKLEQTLEKIQTTVIHKKEVTVKIKYPDGMVKEISAVDSVEILDHFFK